jgi:hypothetical protein
MARKRNKPIFIWVSEEEYALMEEKMRLFGTDNMSSYLRKMAIDGMVIKLDLPEIKEMNALLGRCNGNFNQIAKRINSTNRVYDADIEEMKRELDDIWNKVNGILLKLSKI